MKTRVISDKSARSLYLPGVGNSSGDSWSSFALKVGEKEDLFLLEFERCSRKPNCFVSLLLVSGWWQLFHTRGIELASKQTETIRMIEGYNNAEEVEEILLPPDGGWGWMVVCGSALSHMFIIPILQNFTLIFKDRFMELGFTSTDITTLVSLNASFGMILGLLNGPLLKIFGYRKMALLGLTLYVTGLFCTGIARNYVEFIIFYGLLSSLGVAVEMASFSLALNSYFLKNRSKAVGYTMTLTGVGPVIFPFVITHLLSRYGLKGAVFLLTGLSLHAYIGALLLQPIKWHMKRQNQELQREDNEENKTYISDVHLFLEISVRGSKISLPSHSAESALKSSRAHSRDLLHIINKEAKQERCKPRKLSVTFLDNDDYKNMMNSTLLMIETIETSEKIFKFASTETLSLESGVRLSDFEKRLPEPLDCLPDTNSEENESIPIKPEGSTLSSENLKSGIFFRFIGVLKNTYDLELLRDPIYLNIMLGLSLAFVGEVVFSTMTPMILKEIGFSTTDTATFMSVIAGCDLLCRFLAPFVGNKLKLNSKEMYLLALFMLLISRASMYLASSYEIRFLVSFGLGVGKGFRSVFWVLVLPDYVPISKLPSASAFQSLINGISILVVGPLIGAIIGLTKSYLSIMLASNVLTFTTIMLWCGEIVYVKYKTKN